jgi:hypothetical protein
VGAFERRLLKQKLRLKQKQKQRQRSRPRPKQTQRQRRLVQRLTSVLSLCTGDTHTSLAGGVSGSWEDGTKLVEDSLSENSHKMGFFLMSKIDGVQLAASPRSAAAHDILEFRKLWKDRDVRRAPYSYQPGGGRE